MDTGFLLDMTDFFCTMNPGGLDRTTLLGGEPTLHPDITKIANEYSQKPIKERRMTTNGIGLNNLKLENLANGAFDHVSISIDGTEPGVNNLTRGRGTFDKILRTMELYRQAGVTLSTNYTVTANNIKTLDEVIPFFADKGVKIINFHHVSLDGNAYNNQGLLVTPTKWIQARDKLFKKIEESKANHSLPHGLTIRIPYIYLTEKQIIDLDYRPLQEQNYHSLDGDNARRLIVFPPTEHGKGLCYMSADLIGQPNAQLGHVTSNGAFVWNNHPSNEYMSYLKSPTANVSTRIKHQESMEGVGEGFIRVSNSFKTKIET